MPKKGSKKVQEKVQREGLKKVHIKVMSLFKVLKKSTKKSFFPPKSAKKSTLKRAPKKVQEKVQKIELKKC